MTTSSNPTLLVPVALEALVVNNYVQDEIPFTLWSPSYENLNQFIPVFPDPVFPGPNTQTNPAKRGVHLHWVLPDAFTNEFRTSGTTTGVNNSQQTNAFPLVPNRWLVARIVPGTSTTTGTCKAWMIQSDYYDPNPNGTTGTSPYLNPFPTIPGAIVQTTLGQKHDLESWVEPNPAQLFLQAIGPANITFAAYTHNVENVFAFVDDLSDLPNANSGVNLTYVVMGWYSNPTEDLIHDWTTAEDWEKLMQKLNWAIPAGLDNNSPVESLPKQSLCQGMIYDVQWQTNTLPNNPGQGANADPNKMSVAVGNKGIDAFTALLESVAQNSGKTINPELMEAFQYNLLPELDQPDGAAQIDLKVQQAWFGSTPGGILWQIVSAQRADLTKTDQPQSQPTPAQEAKLATLNQAQVQLDQDRRRLQSLQQQLYDIWWKNGNANIQGTPSEVGFQQSLVFGLALQLILLTP